MSHDLATPAQRGHGSPEDESPNTLPFGPFDADRHRTMESGLRGWVAEQTGLDLRYVEQLYTFGDRYRDPRELYGGPRVLSVAYLALTQQSACGRFRRSTLARLVRLLALGRLAGGPAAR